MDFFQTVIGTLLYAQDTVPLPLFIVSAILLLIGISIIVWSHAFQLRFIEKKPLVWLERTHPHLPSAAVMITMDFCGLLLLLMGLQGLQALHPFNDPYHGLYLVSLFLLAMGLGTLGEMRWKRTRTYACVFVLGTAAAFLVLSILTLPASAFAQRAISSTCAIAAGLLAWFMLRGDGEHVLKTSGMASCIFVAWILAYTLH